MKALNLLPQSFKKYFQSLRENRNWETYLCGLILFAWPLIESIFIKTGNSYGFGKWSPWETFIVHPLQILLGIYLFFKFYQQNKSLPDKFSIVVIILAILSIVFFATPITISLSLIILFLLIQNKSIIENKSKQNLLLYACLFQAGIAIFQFMLQHNLGLQLINEPILNLNIKGVSKLAIPFLDTELIRSYGTFSHPNILSAFLGLGLISLFSNAHLSLKWKRAAILILVLGLITTLSRNSIYLVPLLLLINYKNFKKHSIELAIISMAIIFILAVRFTSPHTTISNNERLDQITALVEQSDQATGKTLPWEHQPIHNMFLVLWSNYGVFSILILLTIIYAIKNKRKFWLSGNHQLLLLLAIGLSDHFLLTLPIGNYLLWVAITFGPTNQPLLTLPAYQSLADKTNLPSV